VNIGVLSLLILIICCKSFKSPHQKISVDFVSIETPMDYLHLYNVFMFGHLTLHFTVGR